MAYNIQLSRLKTMGEIPFLIDTRKAGELNTQTLVIAEAMAFSLDTLMKTALIIPGKGLSPDPYQAQVQASARQCMPASFLALSYLLFRQEENQINGLFRLKSMDAPTNTLIHIAGLAVSAHNTPNERWYAFSPANLNPDPEAAYNRGRHIIYGTSLPKLVSNLSKVEPSYFAPEFTILMRPFRSLDAQDFRHG